jgi:hypothetical protein
VSLTELYCLDGWDEEWGQTSDPPRPVERHTRGAEPARRKIPSMEAGRGGGANEVDVGSSRPNHNSPGVGPTAREDDGQGRSAV